MAMNQQRVRDHFDSEAFEYDSLIDRLIPHYGEQHEVILAMIPFDRQAELMALDLGCGTGILSHLILRSFPRARVTATDLAGNMLEVCRRNLQGYSERLTTHQADFAEGIVGSGYDIVVSGLSIHHLPDSGKQLLYKRIFEALKPEGILLNRDIVLGESELLTEQYHRVWRQYMKLHGEDDEKWMAKYEAEDSPASVEDQLAWLKDAGFVDVGCHWRYFNFAVFSGRRPKDDPTEAPI